MARSKSSQRWLNEHFSDPYVKRAQKSGYRSRASYKLLEIHQKNRLIKPGMVVVDLGAAPGGWSQVVAELLKGMGRVIALDILPMTELPQVEFIQGDFHDEKVVQDLLQRVGLGKVDLVLSDMAPNVSGIKCADQGRMMGLAELALQFAIRVLKPEGNFLIKVFQGEGSEDYLKLLRHHFRKISIQKPGASRSRSKEIYVLAQGLKIL
jgi:23S rRNA (uridine2552-2'-O)-methyltransferase